MQAARALRRATLPLVLLAGVSAAHAQPVKGELTVPNKPGLGLEFDPEALKKWGS